jgi:hypothetical protein
LCFLKKALKCHGKAENLRHRRTEILSCGNARAWHEDRRAAKAFAIDPHIIDLEGMADATHQIFFEKMLSGMN